MAVILPCRVSRAHTPRPEVHSGFLAVTGRAPPRLSLSLPLQKEKLSAQASLKRHTSLNDLSLTRDEQEIEFLRLQVLEQQHVIDDLSLVRCSRRQPSGRCPGTRVSGMASGLPDDAAEAGWASPTSPR